MDKERSANLKISPIRASLSSCGGLLQAVWVGFAFFYASEAAQALGLVGAILTSSIGGILTAAAVPSIYLAVNRTRSRLWGRYHFTLAIAVLVASLMCAALFSSHSASSKAARIISACIVLPLFVSSVSLTAYVGASISNRLAADDGRSGRRKAVCNMIGLLIGVALCALPFAGLQPDSIGYALAALIIVSGGVVYFASVDCLPRFVRPLQKKPTFSAVKEEFFKKPKKSSALVGAAYFLLAVSAVLSVSFITTATKIYGAYEWLSLVCLASAIVVGICFYALAFKKRMGKIAAIVGASLSAVSAAVMLFVLRFASLPPIGVTVTVAASFVLSGIGGGLSLAGARNSAAKFANGYTAGAAYSLETMLLIVATAAAVSAASALSVLTRTADIVYASVIGAACVAAAVFVGFAYGAKAKEEAQ